MTHDPLRAALLDARVPRYTSYPPANRFDTSVGPDHAAAWLAEVPDGANVSFYVHVPFCRRLCWFCACRTQGTLGDGPLDRYLDHLELEIGLVRDALPDTVETAMLHLGGGTPTLLSADRLDRLGRLLEPLLRRHAETEVAVEIDPCEIDAARLDALVRLGLTRASIGVQDFDPEVQSAIGREQSPETTSEAVEGLKDRGIGSINFDLLYGLPHQTEARLAATLREALRHRPDRIALFGYAHVPWMSRRQRLIPEAALPGPEERLALAARARAILGEEGYIAIGIDHFALPHDPLVEAARQGQLRRNFQGYTTDVAETLIGLGPSAISRHRRGYAQNAAGTGDWQERLRQGRLATARGHALTAQDRLTAELIERLMCDGLVNLAELASRHGASVTGLTGLAEAAERRFPGIATLSEHVLKATSPSCTRLLAAQFDRGLAEDTGQFSMAS